jgi:EAL domain-containing protein (putative c-di-GMP-specific phosphodiesterase class I)
MVALDGHNRATVAELIKSAGEAFERAHKEGGNRIQVADGPTPEHVSADPTVLQMLAENRLQLRCQRLAPIGADSSAKPYFELLLGVMDESGAVVMPRDFIQAAERNDEMHEVDMWVIRNALDWMAKHRSKVDSVGGYSINLSGLTLGDDSLLRYVLERLTESQVPPSKVIFEVTESAAIDTLSVAVNFINTLKEYGCRFALDDFGTGDASFAYLKTLPIDFVKIDGSIVRDIVDNPKDLALVKSINEIGHFLGKKTVAEFVSQAMLSCAHADCWPWRIDGYCSPVRSASARYRAPHARQRIGPGTGGGRYSRGPRFRRYAGPGARFESRRVRAIAARSDAGRIIQASG